MGMIQLQQEQNLPRGLLKSYASGVHTVTNLLAKAVGWGFFNLYSLNEYSSGATTHRLFEYRAYA